ncbi:MAG: hypothetical protein JJ971_10770 [Balneolaceae bacterium]|nr:hypothetical protein [Balneolaceae bacterium]MBO6546271.1 hypothetical protein [Balneolaceae bacterium]MBO6648630.1 hypothetical protein [Balneolaceae bacterium]
MNWVKEALLDILSLIVILVFAFTALDTLYVVIWVYTGFLLISKILVFFVDFLQFKAKKTSVPDWFYHSIYALAIGVLFYSKSYYLTGAWVLVWILSAIQNPNKRKKSVSKS